MADSPEEKDSEFVPEEGPEEGPAALKSLREKLKKAVAEKQEYLEGWQRARADFVNFKKEEAGLHNDKKARINAEFLEGLLPALDALELALKHDSGPILEMLEKQFLDSLRKIGIEKFGVVGEEYDHNKHEALAERGGKHTIESVERSGYSIGDKIIRPAQVII